MMIPVLTTARLTLRGFLEADLDAFAAMQADPAVMRHLGVGESAGRTRSRAESWVNMATFIGQWALRGCGSWAVEHQGRCIGRAGILWPEGWPGPELAYALARESWGQGLASEAAIAARDWAFAHMQLDSLTSFIRPENEPSRALARRMGARPAGLITLGGATAERWIHARG